MYVMLRVCINKGILIFLYTKIDLNNQTFNSLLRLSQKEFKREVIFNFLYNLYGALYIADVTKGKKPHQKAVNIF